MTTPAAQQYSLEEVIDFVWNNECPWYRERWAAHGITKKPIVRSVADLAQLPIISKADFLKNVHPLDHTFIPTTDVLTFRSTSGTTGGTLFLYPRQNFSPDIRDIFKADGARTFLYMGGVHKSAPTVLEYAEKDMAVVTGDVHKLDDAIAAIIEGGVDTISSSPTVLRLLAPYLQKANYHTNIAFVGIYGELLTQHTWDQIQDWYPNARMYTEYALSEAGQGIGYTTPESNLGLNCYTTYESATCEIVDEELVVTTLTTPHPLPLIRYKTGDAARFINEDKNTDTTTIRSFELTGRKNVDWVRAGGLELRYNTLLEALTHVPSKIKVESIHATVAVNEFDQIMVKFYVTLTGDTAIEEAIALPLIIETLKEHWWLSQTKNLGHYITSNQCLEPTIETVAKSSALKQAGIKLITT